MKISKSSDLFRNLIFTLFLVLLSAPPSGAAVFNCPSGDVACLINAIEVANANGEPDTIKLADGVYTLTTVDNFIDDEPNGLPLIISEIVIRGKGPHRTVIRGDPSLEEFSDFRIIYIDVNGNLTVDGIAIKGGRGSDFVRDGAGLFNRGTVSLKNSIVSENVSVFGTGGIQNQGGTMNIADSFIIDNYGIEAVGAISTRGGTVNIERSTIARNSGELAGVSNSSGNVTITNSAIVNNCAGAGIGGIHNSATMTITNSTIAENRAGIGIGCGFSPFALAVAEPFGAGGIDNSGTLKIQSSTIARNVFDGGDPIFVTGGILNRQGGTVELQNTIVAANNNVFHDADCAGVITSLGNNLIGDTADCDITLHPTDLSGDPGLGVVFTDDGMPGHGHYPIVRTSQARNAGDDDSCPARDQIGNKRKKPCDIGAIEFRLRPPLIVIFENLTDRQSEILIPSAK